MRIWTSGSRCPRIGLRGGYYSSIQIHPVLGRGDIGAYVGGRRRRDRRYKTRRMWLPRNYFQIYLKDRNWEPDRRDRVVVGEEIGGENWPESRPTEDLVSVTVPPSSRRAAKV